MVAGMWTGYAAVSGKKSLNNNTTKYMLTLMVLGLAIDSKYEEIVKKNKIILEHFNDTCSASTLPPVCIFFFCSANE